MNLSSGRYLVLGVDIPRIGDGPDPAMWLRAYRDDGARFVRVAAAEFAQDRQRGPGNEGGLISLQLTGLEPLAAAHFWFVATSRRMQGDLGTVVLRIGRFDGETFTAVGGAPDIFPSVSPTVQGPIKVDEWDADSR